MPSPRRVPFSFVDVGQKRYASALPRHRHRHGYLEVVLSGEFVEAGDEGRRRLAAGDVLVHRPFEAHMDRFLSGGAEILNLPLLGVVDAALAGFTDDVDLVARLAETDPVAASELSLETLQPRDSMLADWPDLLASALGADSRASITDWARNLGLAAATVSRGFRAAYGCTAAAFRGEARARRSWWEILSTDLPLSELAAGHGFADQPHMTRAVVALTGRSPGAWRRAGVNSVQDTRGIDR